MRTPDLYFTSTKVLIRLLNRSTKIHSMKDWLLFSSTDMCSGGLHRWGRHRDWATLTNSQHSSSGKGKFKQQVKSPVGAGNSTKHQSSLARPSCISHLFPRCFPPGILKHYLPLAVPSNKWCSKRKIRGLDVPPFSSCLHKRHFRMRFACKRWPWLRRQAEECKQLGRPMATLSSSLHFFHPCLADTWIWLFKKGCSLCNFTAKTTYHKWPQSRTLGSSVCTTKWHTNTLGRAEGVGAWEVWSWPSDPSCCCKAKGKCCSCVHVFLIIRTALHASGYPASIHGHIKVTEVGTPVSTNRHLLQMFIKSLSCILLKFLEGDSEAKPLPTTAAGCLLATTSLTYTTTSVMRRIPQYLTNNNPCS